MAEYLGQWNLVGSGMFVNKACPGARLQVNGSYGVVIHDKSGAKKVKVSVIDGVAVVVGEYPVVYKAGHLIRSWLNGKEVIPEEQFEV